MAKIMLTLLMDSPLANIPFLLNLFAARSSYKKTNKCLSEESHVYCIIKKLNTDGAGGKLINFKSLLFL